MWERPLCVPPPPRMWTRGADDRGADDPALEAQSIGLEAQAIEDQNEALEAHTIRRYANPLRDVRG